MVMVRGRRAGIVDRELHCAHHDRHHVAAERPDGRPPTAVDAALLGAAAEGCEARVLVEGHGRKIITGMNRALHALALVAVIC